MRIARLITTTLFVAACCLCFAATAFAQGTSFGTIRGTVTDPQGATVPKATVQVTDQATAISRDLTTDSDGNYEAAALKPGVYKVSVSASGFKTTTRAAV